MIRKRTTLTTTERRQRLFCLLFGCILLGTAWGMVMLRWQYDGVPTGWAGFLGMFFQTKPTLPALWTESAGDILLFLLAFFLLGFSAVGQPFAWLLLLTYGVCMGGTLQTQCSAGGAFVRSTTLLCYFVPMSALLVLAAARLLRRENRRKSYVAAGRQNPGWAAAVPGWQRDSFLRFSQIPRMRDGVCWRMIA